MALALSPQHSMTGTRAQGRTGVAPLRHDSPVPSATGLRLSVECRTRRNREIRSRYEAELRQRQQAVYARRRIAATLIIVTIAAAACLGVRGLASRGDGSASLPTVTPQMSAVMPAQSGADLSAAFVRGAQVYVVQPGDTLWSIASSLTDGSIRGYVDEMIELNGAASIAVGQRLVLPAD